MNESDTSLANKTGHFNLLTTGFLYLGFLYWGGQWVLGSSTVSPSAAAAVFRSASALTTVR
jgi:hypothetical protein